MREMATTLFDLLKDCIESNQYEKARFCLLLLDNQDKAIFSHHEQTLIYVMQKIVELNIDVKALQVISLSSLNLKNPARCVQQVRKRGIIVHLDYPTFFVCYVNPSHRYFFTKKGVEVVSSKNKSVMVYPLQLEKPSAMPIDVKLSSKKAIVWLLDNGFSPVVKDRAMTLVQLTDRELFEPLITECVALCRDRNRKDRLQAMLWTVRASLSEELYDVAISNLQRAYDMSRNTCDEARVKELYDAAQALKLQAVICLDAVTDPRNEWIKKCSQLCSEREGINDELAFSLQMCKVFVEQGSYTLAKGFLENRVQTCPVGPYVKRVDELYSLLIILEQSSPAPLASELEDNPTLSEEVFNALARLSQLPASNKETRVKLYKKLSELDPQNRAYYEQRMRQDPASQQHDPKLLGGIAQAKELLEYYKTKDNLEKFCIVANYLRDLCKDFETSLELAEALILDDKTSDGLNIYFAIALESVRPDQIPNLKKCLAAIHQHYDLLDENQKNLLFLFDIMVK
jgi:hypothetical protein